jgi:hypothetical protein
LVSESVALTIIPAPFQVKWPEVYPFKDEYTKIRLSFLTDDPKHVRSLMLQQSYNSKSPFVEDVCVLLPRMQVFSILETFFPVFERLRETGIVSPAANLLGFKVLDEDIETLAYLFNS